MKINICSLFRDSQIWHGYTINQVDRYFKQLKAQEDFLKSKFEKFNGFIYFCGEKDSKDNTREALLKYQIKNPNIHIIDTERNSKSVESTVDRVFGLSKVANSLLNPSLKIESDYTLWIESDIILNSDDIIFGLLEKLQEKKENASISPIIWTETFIHNQKCFYDTWGFICENGTPWKNFYPFNINYILSNFRYLEMSSVGSCVLTKSSFIQENQFGTGAFREFCENITKSGGKIFADKYIEIYHPSQYYIEKRQI